MRKRCEQCGEQLPTLARRHTKTCSDRCRKRASRARHTLPAEMTSRRRWVRRAENKVPLRVDNGHPASSTDPSTWSTYSTAARSDRGDGLGYVLADGDGLTCIDLDHCLIDGELADWARRVLDRCPPTFVEVSTSGAGLHVWGRGTPGPGRKIRTAAGANVEVYGQERYIAVTGRRFEGSPVALADLSEVVASLT